MININVPGRGKSSVILSSVSIQYYNTRVWRTDRETDRQTGNRQWLIPRLRAVKTTEPSITKHTTLSWPFTDLDLVWNWFWKKIWLPCVYLLHQHCFIDIW